VSERGLGRVLIDAFPRLCVYAFPVPNLARAKPRPAVHAPPAAKTKILLVRQPVKSVRKSDEPDRAALKLAIGVIAALGVIGAVWFIGFLGHQLGFARLMRVPELSLDVGGGLVVGALVLISLPQVIIQAGIAQPMWLMVGFVLIAIPAASLGAVKPLQPGGPKVKPAIVAISFAGAIFGMINAIALIWWTVSPIRRALIEELPFDFADVNGWLDNLRLAAGMDALATVAAALWVVMAMKLAIPAWMRGLSASACFFALVVVTVAMAMSNATVSQVNTGRSVYLAEEGSLDERLVVGFTPQSIVTLHVENYRSIIEVSDKPASLTVVGTQSIAGYLDQRKPVVEP